MRRVVGSLADSGSRGLRLVDRIGCDLSIRRQMASSKRVRYGYLPRIADDALAAALKSSGAAAIVGPKACGKTETARQRAASEERLTRLRPLLEQATERSAQLLCQILGALRLEPAKGDVRRPYYLARTSIDALALPDPTPGAEGSVPGSNSLRWWSRRESNPRPLPCQGSALPLRHGPTADRRTDSPPLPVDDGQRVAEMRARAGVSRRRRRRWRAWPGSASDAPGGP